MNPAFSVLVFTVLSGAGLGALALVALLDLATAARLVAPVAPMTVLARTAALALALVVAGLGASTLHLANPKNAWRAASRWRTSWLSREAVVSLALLLCATLFVLALWFDAATIVRVAIALPTLLLAWATLHCTAMIYASLKPIRQWHTWRVPLNYLLLGHASGALVVAAMVRDYWLSATWLMLVALALFAAAALAKLDYWRFLRTGHGALTIEQAIGVAQGVGPRQVPGAAAVPSVMAARLLDAGHSRGTFLTREFVQVTTTSRRTVVQLVMWVGAFALPAIWLLWGLPWWQGGVLACVACMIGLLAERWLFFADARHTVRLFHGEKTTR